MAKYKFNIVYCLGIVWISLVSLFFLHEISLNFKQSEVQFQNDISQMLQKAITLEKDKKVIDSKLLVLSSYSEEDTSRYIQVENKEKQYRVEKSSETKEYTITEKQERMLQTVFRTENPIQPVVLDSVFYVLLSPNIHPVRTAVRYKDNITGIVSCSISDTACLKSAFHTKEILTGIENEISLQGYVFVSWWEVLGKSKGRVWGLIISWILVIVFSSVSLLVYRKKVKSVSIPEPILTPEPVLTPEPASVPIPFSPEARILTLAELPSHKQVIVQLTPELYWIVDSSSLMHNNVVVPLSPQLTQIFLLFLDDSEHFVLHETIMTALWGNKEYANGKDKLDKAIARFRKALESVPEIQIENDRGKGYVMTITSSSFLPEADTAIDDNSNEF